MADPRLAAARIRYNYACGYCGVTEISTGSLLTLDHYQPRAAGGDDADDNLVYACIKCNQNKHAFWPTPEERMKGIRVLHPLSDETNHHFAEDEHGYLQPLTTTGNFHIALLDLNRPQLVQHRLARQIQRTLIEKVASLEEQEKTLQNRFSALEQTIVMLEAFLRRSTMIRCAWPGDDPLMIQYHDEEWGVPLHDDRKHFEFIVLDGNQAGLSWRTVLYKRENFRTAFDQFDVHKVAQYDEAKIAELLSNPGIIRNKQKIAAAIKNARAFLTIQAEFGSFDAYIWQFVNGQPLINQWHTTAQIPAQSPEAEAMSKDLIKRGFSFVGPTICYAYMQAAGMVNDHLVDCFRYKSG